MPVYDKPMIHYPIQTLVNAGIKDIVVVTGGPHSGDFTRVLKDGREFGANHIYYTFQDRVGGIAGAISTAEPFTDGEPVAVILGDNCTDADISKDIEEFKEGAMVFFKEVPDPERFGNPILENGILVGIEEKPTIPHNNYAVTGLYLYDYTVFDKIRSMEPSARGELEITDLNNIYLKEGKLRWAELGGYWRDAGTFETLWEVGSFWRDRRFGGKERG